jgi:hypothetical protein
MVEPRTGMRKRYGVGLLVTVAVLGSVIDPMAAGAASDLCIAANDAVRHQSGTATCDANGTASVAIAKGAESDATAVDGEGNRAKGVR